MELRVTPRVLTYYNKDDTSQVNPGSVTYATSVTPKPVNELLTFKWKDDENKTVTLTEGTDINYTYTVPADSGGSAQEVTANFLPMAVGTYSVQFNLLNPNYTFAQTPSGTTNTLTIEANVTGEDQERAYISVFVDQTEFTYDGTGKLPVSGILTAYESESSDAAAVDIGTFTVHIKGLNETVYDKTVDGIAAGTDITAVEGLELPKAPGTYVIIVSAANTSYYLYKSQVFSIDKATVTIKPDDKTAYVGDAVPTLGENDYTVTGLAENDTLTTNPTLSYEVTPDMSTAGTYTIQASGAAVNTDYYTLAYESGTLTVSNRSSSGNPGSGTTYAVSVGSSRNGTVAASPKNAGSGTTVTLTVTPDEGYVLDKLTVTDKDGNTVKLTNKGNGKYTFTMPRSAVTVEAAFVPETDPDIAFVDVPADAYYADAVAWAVENGITNGTSATTFSPDASCTRAQMVTFLWRAAGSPKAAGSNPFEDVTSTSYYYDAVLWAVEQGITVGTSATTFSPDAVVTRSQTVTFLYRYAGSPAVSESNPFADVDSSAYYANAVQWAVSNGITNGTGNNTFSPDADCTRAQIVTFLYRDMAD